MVNAEKIEIWGFEHALRGMRNPMNSWEKSDSKFDNIPVYIGDADLDLMRRLFKAGTEHRKFMRQIFVSMDITAPLYWWKEFDTYKVGTVANSCSTMHKIQEKEFTIDDFSTSHLIIQNKFIMESIIESLNEARMNYISTKEKMWWWQMIQLLPSSYNQKRTITMNYENAASMIRQRSGHKLYEWNHFVEILKDLPYMMEIIGDSK